LPSEADEKEQEAFRRKIENWARERFIFVDETGANIDMARRYGRAAPGQRVEERLPRNTPKSLTLIGALGKDGLKAPMELEGAVNKEAFLVYLNQCLGPELQPGDIVFADNLSAHRGKEMEEAVSARGAKLVYLPRYSPEFNPIEKCWSKLKTALRSAGARTMQALKRAIAAALNTITPQDARGWFAHAGYLL
jgi:transposase